VSAFICVPIVINLLKEKTVDKISASDLNLTVRFLVQIISELKTHPVPNKAVWYYANKVHLDGYVALFITRRFIFVKFRLLLIDFEDIIN